MNLEAFQKGLYGMEVSIGMVFTGAVQPLPAQTAPLLQPEIAEAINLPSASPSSEDNYNLELPPITQQVTVALPSETPTPSITPSSAPKASVVTVEKPVKKPSPSPKPKESAKVTSINGENSEEDKSSPTPSPVAFVKKLAANAEKLFQQINDHRKTLGLTPFEKEERICKIAEDRAPQIHDEVFKEGPIHKGFKALNLPYWATENAAAYESLEQNLKFWLSDSIHKKAIEGDSKYSCIACSGTSCSQIFTSFTPKK